MKNSYLVNLVNIHGLSFSTIQIKDFILYFLKLGFKFSSPLVLCLKTYICWFNKINNKNDTVVKLLIRFII